MKLIDKTALVAEIDRRIQFFTEESGNSNSDIVIALFGLKSFIDTLEVKEVDSIIHTIIAECCDWLVINTNLTHDEIECCRNLMLTVKEEQFKAQKGE